MKHAISQLQISLGVCENNEPINRDEGNVAQAELEAKVATELRQAIVILEAVESAKSVL